MCVIDDIAACDAGLSGSAAPAAGHRAAGRPEDDLDMDSALRWFYGGTPPAGPPGNDAEPTP